MVLSQNLAFKEKSTSTILVLEIALYGHIERIFLIKVSFILIYEVYMKMMQNKGK